MVLNGRTQGAQTSSMRSDISLLINDVEEKQGFALHIIAFDQDAQVKPVLAQLNAAFGKKIVHIELPFGDDPIKFLIESFGAVEQGKVAIVTGFNKYIPPQTETLPDMILEALNYEIFEIRSRPCQLIFVVPAEYIGYIQSSAPDIWELNSGLYAIEKLPDDRYRTVQLICDYFTEICGEATHTQRLNKITYYKALHAQKHTNGTIERTRNEFDMLGKLAILHFKLGAFFDAINYLEEQMMLAGKMADNTLLPEIFNNLGMVNEAMGNSQDAFDYLQTAWERSDTAFKGNSHPSKALILCNLSNVLCSLGHYQEASLNCRQSLRMCENKLGMRHQQLVPILINFGRILCCEKKLDASLDNFRRALQIVEKKLDLEHPYVSIILQHIGLVYLYQNKTDVARRYFYRTLEMTEKILGPEHPYLAVQLNHTGLAHCDPENVQRALKYFDWAYELRTSTVGSQDPITAEILSNIGRAYEIKNMKKEAMASYRQALAIYRLKLPLDHPYIAEIEQKVSELEGWTTS